MRIRLQCLPLRRRQLVGQTRGYMDGMVSWPVARKSSGVAAKLHGSISWHWNNTENSPTGAKLLVIDQNWNDGLEVQQRTWSSIIGNERMWHYHGPNSTILSTRSWHVFGVPGTRYEWTDHFPKLTTHYNRSNHDGVTSLENIPHYWNSVPHSSTHYFIHYTLICDGLGSPLRT